MKWSWILVVIPSSLYAVDGVVLIDQSRALAGNITPGDMPGFPVTISQTGSYRLTGNLTVPDADTTAILITGDHVTLDLNGFSILGPVVCTSSPAVCPTPGKGAGIQNGDGITPASRAIRVLNGTIRGMGATGILIFGQGSSVEGVVADSNAGGGMLVDGSVFKCQAGQNGGFGILGIIVRDSIALDNKGDGIVLDGSGGVGVGNIASFNGRTGIRSPNGTVTSNTVVRNVGFGITAVCPSSIVNNTVVSNTAGSITTENGTTGCVFTDNATRP